MNIKEQVKKRLSTFGYEYKDEDEWLLGFLYDKNKNYIRNQINRKDIPEQLYEVLIDKITGDFLEGKWASGQLDIDNLNLDGVAKKIQEGDTTVEMATSKDGVLSPEDRFLRGIKYLQHLDFSYAKFRVFTW